MIPTLSRVSQHRAWSLDPSSPSPLLALSSGDLVSLLFSFPVCKVSVMTAPLQELLWVKYLITCSALESGLDVGQAPCHRWRMSALGAGFSLCLESTSPLGPLSHSLRSLLKCTFSVRPYLAALLKTRNYLLAPCNFSSSFMFLHMCVFLSCPLLSVSPK